VYICTPGNYLQKKKRSLADKYVVRSKFTPEVLVFGFRTSGREVDRRAYLSEARRRRRRPTKIRPRGWLLALPSPTGKKGRDESEQAETGKRRRKEGPTRRDLRSTAAFGGLLRWTTLPLSSIICFQAQEA
jgi:hypothetical protein